MDCAELAKRRGVSIEQHEMRGPMVLLHMRVNRGVRPL